METEKLKIGIDLDDVVFEFVNLLIENYEKEFGKKLLFEDFFSYAFAEVWHLNLEETISFIEQILKKEIVEDMKLCEFSKENILKLSKKNKIYFITSRIFREGTLESLNKHFSDLDFELVFSSNPYANTEGKTKGDLCEELGIDFMIEDCPKHSLICAQKGIKTILLEKPWNKNCENHENLIKLKNWREVLGVIDEH